MSDPATAILDEPSTPTVLEYQLTEADVRRYCVAGRPRACWLACRERKVGLAILGAIWAFLVGLCFARHGATAGSLALGSSLAVVLFLTWLRRARSDHRVCRLARAMGLPYALRLVVSDQGIVKEPGDDPSDPGRSFAWSEVVEVARVDALTVVRLRPAGALLIVPDRAFPDPEAREALARHAQGWLDAAAARSARDS